MTSHHARTPEETEALAERLARALGPGSVVALHGELGAGKTCFVRGLARGLGHDPASVSSPTFVIEHRYDAPGRTPLVHLDAYRLRGPEDLPAIGWEELLAEAHAVVVVEWAERIGAALPDHARHITLRHAPGGREIVFDDSGPGRVAAGDVP